jgi:hypothetical protein
MSRASRRHHQNSGRFPKWLFVAATLQAVAPASSAEQRLAPRTTVVFEFELLDTSLEGATTGTRPDERRRLDALDENLSRLLEAHGFSIVPLDATTSEKAQRVHLYGCNGCEADLAAAIGAEIAVTGLVQKVSNLILNITLVARDGRSGQILGTASADMRGNTDQTWSRALDAAAVRLLEGSRAAAGP